jgi:hypothetical protein
MPRRDFPSFGMLTDEGDIAVHRMVTCIVTDINLGRIRRLELEGRIKLGCTWVDETGHREVWALSRRVTSRTPSIEPAWPRAGRGWWCHDSSPG